MNSAIESFSETSQTLRYEWAFVQVFKKLCLIALLSIELISLPFLINGVTLVSFSFFSSSLAL